MAAAALSGGKKEPVLSEAETHFSATLTFLNFVVPWDGEACPQRCRRIARIATNAGPRSGVHPIATTPGPRPGSRSSRGAAGFGEKRHGRFGIVFVDGSGK